ncbi:unnamed protein product [Symbiodinium natans]|uniref:EF-hand domain-containing protein n=1 Tax=Symbiodinium natans TaxID=878477 RepID=A0A812SDN8_9DINO|nr:unnamed protein product [Symbiodinium natans]
MAGPDAWGVSGEQESSALAVLQVAAEGELALEQARCRLCELREFDPNEFFLSLFAHWSSAQQGWISVHDVFSWLGQQLHSAAGILVEEVAAVLAPVLNPHGELRYNGFLRLVLPRDPANSWLKEATLLRSGYRGGPSSQIIPTEVSYRFCRLIEGERDLIARLGIQRRRLADLQPHRKSLEALLTAPGGPRHLLVDRLKVCDDVRCEALLRRVGLECNWTSGGIIPAASAEELVDFILKPQPGWIRGGPEMRAFQAATGQRGELRSGAGSASWSPRRPPPSLGSYAACAARQAAAEASNCIGSLSRQASSPRRSPGGPGGPGGPGAPAQVPLWQSREWPFRQANGGSRERAILPEDARNPVVDMVIPAHQLSAPPPPMLEPARPVGLYQPSKAALSPRSASGYVAPNRGMPFMMNAPSSPRALPRDPGAPPGRVDGRGWPWWEEEVPGQRHYSPPRGSGSPRQLAPRLPLPQRSAPPRPTSPSHRAWLVEAGGCAGRDGSPVGSGRLHSPSLGRPRPSELGRADVSRSGHSPRLRLPDGFYEGPLWAPPREDASELRMLRTALQAMVRQAACDAEAEDAKAMLGPGAGACGLPAFFKVLDPWDKGHVLDTDLLQLVKEHEAPVSFASLCSLVHEANVRRGGGLLGHLTFRDLGKLIFPIQTKEYKAMCDSATDDEAKSILYLLQYSEPCPRCGFRIQRDSDSAGCPNVVCSHCQAAFRCFVVARPFLDAPAASAADRYTLCRLIAAVARTAENLELDRKRLAAHAGFDQTCLREVFHYISSGQPTFDIVGLRQAFRDQQIPVAEKELDLLWQRYAPSFGAGVSLEHFQRQLRYDPMWTPEGCTATNRLLVAVVQTMLRQATADAATEDGKALRPKCPLVALFRSLDPMGKGYLLDTDVWQLVQDFRGSSTFSSLCTLVQEVQLRRRYGDTSHPGRLSLREFGVLAYPLDSKEYEALGTCRTDVEAKSVLYVLQNSETCPTCGLRVQRESDSTSCPEVQCPMCRTVFRCIIVGSSSAGWEDDTGASRLSVQARQQLHRTIAAAASAAEELEKDRLRLSQFIGHDITALSDVFNFLAQGRQSFTLPDFRRALTHLQLRASEHDLELIWRRYAQPGSATVSFADFVRQLKPLTKAATY